MSVDTLPSRRKCPLTGVLNSNSLIGECVFILTLNLDETKIPNEG